MMKGIGQGVGCLLIAIAIVALFSADRIFNLIEKKLDRSSDTRTRTITEAQLSGDTLKIKTQHDANNH